MCACVGFTGKDMRIKALESDLKRVNDGAAEDGVEFLPPDSFTHDLGTRDPQQVESQVVLQTTPPQ